MASITHHLRIEPRPRSNEIGVTMAAEIRDPLWFLTRQWQLGELSGTDAGSVAYVEYAGRSSAIPRAVIAGSTRPVDPNVPLERQTLVEPFFPDLGLKVELGQDFHDLLTEEVNDAVVTQRLFAAFAALAGYRIDSPPDNDEFDPLDPASKRFVAVCAGRAVDGQALYALGKAIAAGTGSVPGAVTGNAGEAAKVRAALARFVTRVDAVFGALGTGDPEAWQPSRLEYAVRVVAASPAAQGNATLTAEPDEQGQYDWSSFDVVQKNASATEAAPTPIAFTMIPADVRFPGMPNPRFWMFESNELSFVDIKPNKRDVLKLLVADFMLIHGSNWYSLPLDQDVGSLVKTDTLVVVDVFGYSTLVQRADQSHTAPGPDRWTMFSVTDASGTTESLADYFVLAPTTGPAMELGEVLEDVRFGRDEMANMAWGIERVTQSPIGEPRSGRERDALVDARLPPEALAQPGTTPFRYSIESQIPINFIPLVGVQPNAGNPSIVLEKAAALRPKAAGGVGVVRSTGKILSPSGVAPPYRIEEEEVPRSGSRVERVVFRTRWHDGRTHLWTQRRRLAGAGESQGGLRFDQALPNTR